MLKNLIKALKKRLDNKKINYARASTGPESLVNFGPLVVHRETLVKGNF